LVYAKGGLFIFFILSPASGISLSSNRRVPLDKSEDVVKTEISLQVFSTA
jgi:hypothetical protein